MTLPLSPIRESVTATYDSRETGHPYWVTATINDRPVGTRHELPDPFVRHTLRISLADLLRGVLRRGLTVEVTVSGEMERMNDVLELDENNLVPGRTRRVEFQAGMHNALGDFAGGAR